MENSVLQHRTGFSRALFAVFLSVALSACSSTTSQPGPSADAASVKTGAESTDSDATPADIAALTPISDEALQAALADDFWRAGSAARIGDDGNLVYSAEGTIIDDPNYNRAQLQTYRLDRSNGQAIYDPITGQWIWISGARAGRVAGTRPSSRDLATGTPRGVTPAPRVVRPSVSPRHSNPPQRRSSGSSATDSRR